MNDKKIIKWIEKNDKDLLLYLNKKLSYRKNNIPDYQVRQYGHEIKKVIFKYLSSII